MGTNVSYLQKIMLPLFLHRLFLLQILRNKMLYFSLMDHMTHEMVLKRYEASLEKLLKV